MANLGDLFVTVGANIEGFERAFGEIEQRLKAVDRDAEKAGASFEAIGSRISGLGSKMLPVTAALAGIGVAAGAAAIAIDDAYDKIRIGTGAQGADLAALEQSFRTLFASLPVSSEQAATAIADLNTRLGLTGPALESVATQVLNLSRITGEDLGGVIQSTTRVMGDWGVQADQMSGSLDFLFKVSQSTGIGVTQLSNSLVQFGAPLRQMGFDMETSAALLGQFEKQGVNTELVLGSLRIALTRMAKEGVEDAAGGLRILIEQIQAAGSTGEANKLAIEAFGARAGPDMAAAIREGRFEIDEYLKSVRAMPETISSAVTATDGFAEGMVKLKNRATLVLEPLGTALVQALERALVAMEPVFRALESMAVGFAALTPGTQQAIIAFGAVVAALGPVLVIVGQVVRAIGTLVTAKVALGGAASVLGTKLGGVAAAAAGMKVAVVAAATAANAAVLSWARSSGEAMGDVILSLFGKTNDKMVEVSATAGRMATAVQSSMSQQATAAMSKQQADAAMRAEMERVTAETQRVTTEMTRSVQAQMSAAQAAAEKAQKAAELKARMEELRTTNAAFISQLDAIQSKMGTTTQTIEKMALDAEILTGKVNAATASKQNLKDVAVPAWIAVADAVGTVPPALDKTAEAVSKQLAAWDSMGRQVSTIITNFTQDISRSIFDGDLSWGEKTKKMLRDLGSAVFSSFIEPAVAAITSFVTGTINGLLKGALENVGEWLGGLGSQVAGIFGGGASGAAGAAGGAAGSAGGGGAAGAAGGALGWAGAIGAIGSMISGIIGNFQMAGMNRTLDLIEWNTRKSSLHLEHLFPVIYDYIDTFRAHWNGGLGIFNQGGDNGIRIAPYEFGAFPVRMEGGHSGVTVNVEGNVIGNQEFIRDLAVAVAEELRLQGAAG